MSVAELALSLEPEGPLASFVFTGVCSPPGIELFLRDLDEVYETQPEVHVLINLSRSTPPPEVWALATRLASFLQERREVIRRHLRRTTVAVASPAMCALVQLVLQFVPLQKPLAIRQAGEVE
jgi:hypothetical protein